MLLRLEWLDRVDAWLLSLTGWPPRQLAASIGLAINVSPIRDRFPGQEPQLVEVSPTVMFPAAVQVMLLTYAECFPVIVACRGAERAHAIGSSPRRVESKSYCRKPDTQASRRS